MSNQRPVIYVLGFGAIALIGAIVLIGTGHTNGNYVDILLGLASSALVGGAGITVPAHLAAAAAAAADVVDAATTNAGGGAPVPPPVTPPPTPAQPAATPPHQPTG